MGNKSHLGQRLPLGQVGIHGDGTRLALLSYGNGHYLARQSQKILAEQHGIAARVIDLRWLAPLPEAAILEALTGVEQVLIVDECRRTGSISEALLSLLHEQASPTLKRRRLTAEDSFIALGRAATVTLPDRDAIISQALALVHAQ